MTTMPSLNDTLCPDWVFLNNSNVHVAKDRDWFTTYTPFASLLGSLYNGQSLKVLGIGTVKIPVKATPKSTVTTYLELKNVLHVPDAGCNAIGQPIFENGNEVYVCCEDDSMGSISNSNREQLAYFHPNRPLFVLAAEAPKDKQFGPAVIVAGAHWLLSCSWDEKEVKRWEEMKKTQSF